MEPTIETITKRKHGVNNTSKANSDSNNINSQIRIKIMLAIPPQAVMKHIKIRIIIKLRGMKNHRKNGNGNKKRKIHRRIKTPAIEKENQAYLYWGIEWLSPYEKN